MIFVSQPSGFADTIVGRFQLASLVVLHGRPFESWLRHLFYQFNLFVVNYIVINHNVRLQIRLLQFQWSDFQEWGFICHVTASQLRLHFRIGLYFVSAQRFVQLPFWSLVRVASKRIYFFGRRSLQFGRPIVAAQHFVGTFSIFTRQLFFVVNFIADCPLVSRCQLQ